MQPQPWPPEKHKNTQQAQQKGEKVEVPVGLKRLHRLRSYSYAEIKFEKLSRTLTYQDFQFLQVFDSKYNCKLGQGKSHRDFGINTRLCRHVVEPLRQVDVPLHPEAQLVHVTKVEHGLGIVLLLACDPTRRDGFIGLSVALLAYSGWQPAHSQFQCPNHSRNNHPV